MANQGKLYNLHFSWDGELWKFTDVRADGWCFYNSLSIGEGRERDGTEIRALLDQGTRKRSKDHERMMKVFKAMEATEGSRESGPTLEEQMEEYNRKVRVALKKRIHWGNKDDAVIYTAMTGRRVVILANQTEGFVVVCDTKEVLQGRVDVNWDGKLSVLFWHKTNAPLGKLDNWDGDHYGVLTKADPSVLSGKKHWIFEGGSTQAISVEGKRKKRRNQRKAEAAELDERMAAAAKEKAKRATEKAAAVRAKAEKRQTAREAARAEAQKRKASKEAERLAEKEKREAKRLAEKEEHERLDSDRCTVMAGTNRTVSCEKLKVVLEEHAA